MAKVSVCVATYNRQAYLREAIQSILQQTLTDWELLVCDDGSQDGTPEMMAEWAGDARIHYIRHDQNIGKSNNMRSGFERATGDYFIKFDDDDRLAPDFLEKTVAVLEQDSALAFVATDHWVIDPAGDRDLAATEKNSQFWGRSTLREGVIDNLLAVVFVHQSVQIGATLFRRSPLMDLGYMRPNIQNCEDNDLLVRLALAGYAAYYLPERLMEYRFHPEQKDFGKSLRYLEDKINYLGFYAFEDGEMEEIRIRRLRECQLNLGLRLIEVDRVGPGRSLAWQGREHSQGKALAALGLSLLPGGIRGALFGRLRGA